MTSSSRFAPLRTGGAASPATGTTGTVGIAGPSTLSRRGLLTGVLGAAALGLAACATDDTGGPRLAAAAPLPTAVPPGTGLTISIHRTRRQLEAAGTIGRVPFTVRGWPNISAGPDVIQGFRARSIDLASNAGIPPIQAAAINVEARIVAVQTKQRPIYQLATAPGSDVDALPDLRGRKIAFSQGQAQGLVVLRTLKQLGLKTSDVTLVELPSTKFLVALQSRQVDVAPLFEPALTKYLTEYRADGARGLHTSAVDYLTVLWAPTRVLEDPGKAAAIRAFIPFWAQGNVWAHEHPDAWIEHYYVKDQGVTAEDGRRIVAAENKPVFPVSWDRAIEWEQDTADLLADGGFVPPVTVADLFDRRFEKLAALSVPPAYRE